MFSDTIKQRNCKEIISSPLKTNNPNYLYRQNFFVEIGMMVSSCNYRTCEAKYIL